MCIRDRGLDPAAVAAPKAPDLDDVENLVVEDAPMDPGEIQFGYCTEFVVKNKDCLLYTSRCV